MILAVDIGNSNIVLGCFEDEKILFIERLSTNQNQTTLEYTILIKNILELNGLSHHSFEGGIISSVVPSVTHTVQDAMSRLTGKPVMVVGPGIRTGLKILLDNPAQLGSDRVADAVAAIHDYPCPLIVVDMGTATTISVVDRNKNFLGGMIIPGLRVSLDSLTMRTSQLPKISLDPPKRVIGSNTIDCMRSGIIYSTASSIDGTIERIEEELGETCTIISTGGLAKTIIPYCKRKILIDDRLLLKGLMIIYNKNASK
ncbi:MAG: type III pantothenate kinase [Lachnospiraceae bacterium]|jgi:type III pantothenate kinase|nr:type III pantothenate kinase [Lachnospiraceae bacterium]RKJ48015.1 type III pantothenate kinase [bacterium 1XD42-54]